MCEAADLKRQVVCEKGYVSGSGLKGFTKPRYFRSRRLVGLWEYDTATESIAWMSFIAKIRIWKKR